MNLLRAARPTIPQIQKLLNLWYRLILFIPTLYVGNLKERLKRPKYLKYYPKKSGKDKGYGKYGIVRLFLLWIPGFNKFLFLGKLNAGKNHCIDESQKSFKEISVKNYGEHNKYKTCKNQNVVNFRFFHWF